MIDLYGALGIDKTADAAAIKRAYRKAAKRAHPDGGGSVEEFALITLAHDCLSDKERRVRYDQTGDVGEKPAIDTQQAQALNAAMDAIQRVLAVAEQKNFPIEQVDVLGDAIKTISNQRSQMALEISKQEANAKKLERLAKRFKAKHSKVDRIGPMLLAQAAGQRHIVEQNQHSMATLKMAIDVLKDHEFSVGATNYDERFIARQVAGVDRDFRRQGF